MIVNSNSYSILSSSRSLTGSTGNYPRYPLNTGGITGPSGYTLITPLNLTSNKAEIQNIIEETALIITANTSSGVTNESGSYYTGGYLQGLTGSAFGTVGTFQGVTGSISASPNIYFDTTKTCFYKNVGINLGETGPSFTLDVSGNIRATQGITGATGSFSYLYSANTVTASDYRIKENVTPLNNSYVVDELIPVTYTNKITERQDMGLIAHELQEVFPFLVNGEKDGKDYQSVNYTGLIPLLIKEVKELKEKVKSIEEKLTK